MAWPWGKVEVDSEQLRAFIKVAEHRSVSAAARELGLSQPALSRSLQRLESEIGVPLLDRTQRPLGLTPAGETLLKSARDVLDRWLGVVGQVQAQAGAERRRLRIAASTTPGEFLVPQLVAQFNSFHPDVEPSVAIMDSEAVVEALLARRSDAGFIGAPLRDPRLTLLKVAEDRLVLAVPSGHPFARRHEVSLEELEGVALLFREGGSGTYQSLLRRLAEQGRSLPQHRVAMVLGSTQAIVSAVRAGLGMGFVSNLALGDSGATGVCALSVEGIDLRRELYLAYEEARLGTPLVREFIEFVVARAS